VTALTFTSQRPSHLVQALEIIDFGFRWNAGGRPGVRAGAGPSSRSARWSPDTDGGRGMRHLGVEILCNASTMLRLANEQACAASGCGTRPRSSITTPELGGVVIQNQNRT
jgi:hypothetical protein